MGALTLKTNSFKNRPWDIEIENTINILDPYFYSIRVDTMNEYNLRILPIVSDEEWLSDNAVFSMYQKLYF